MNVHEKYLKHCLVLAQKGFGKVAPNPMVGCVIVYKEKIIGQGYHKKYGSAHAEVNAINAVKNKKLLKDSTLYVTLEPCSHFGKTPPCADLVVAMGIKYVVVGTIDPNPLVAGKGLQKLASAGCDVKMGILEDECRELNKRFFTFYEKKRPYIILKWTHTADGYIGMQYENGDGRGSIQISGNESGKLVHQWRSEEQAIMVGTNTALVDNPQLTVRKIKGNNPIRILIDRQLKIPPDFHLLDGSVRTIVFTEKEKAETKNIEYVLLDFKKDVLKQIMTELYKKKIQSLIVEGGARLLNSFIQKNIWDEARVFTSKKNLNEIIENKTSGVEAPKIAGKVIAYEKLGADQLLVLSNIS